MSVETVLPKRTKGASNKFFDTSSLPSNQAPNNEAATQHPGGKHRNHIEKPGSRWFRYPRDHFYVNSGVGTGRHITHDTSPMTPHDARKLRDRAGGTPAPAEYPAIRLPRRVPGISRHVPARHPVERHNETPVVNHDGPALIQHKTELAKHPGGIHRRQETGIFGSSLLRAKELFRAHSKK